MDLLRGQIQLAQQQQQQQQQQQVIAGGGALSLARTSLSHSMKMVER